MSPLDRYVRLFPALVLVSSLALTGCSGKPKYETVVKANAAEIDRAEAAMRDVVVAVRAAPPAPLGGWCERKGLTRARESERFGANFAAGDTELVSFWRLEHASDQGAHLEPSIGLGGTSVSDGPMHWTTLLRSRDRAARVRDGDLRALEASRGVRYLIALRGVEPARLEAHLFDVGQKRIVCSFAVEGKVSPGAENRKWEVTNRQTGSSHTFTEHKEEESLIDNARWLMGEELVRRFAISLSDEPRPTSIASANAVASPSVDRAK